MVCSYSILTLTQTIQYTGTHSDHTVYWHSLPASDHTVYWHSLRPYSILTLTQTIHTHTHPLTYTNQVCILMGNACWMLSTLTASSNEYARNDVSGRTGSVKMDVLRGPFFRLIEFLLVNTGSSNSSKLCALLMYPLLLI